MKFPRRSNDALRLLCLLIVSCCFQGDLNVAHAPFENASSLLGILPATNTAAQSSNVLSSFDFSFADPQLPPPLSIWYGDYGKSWFLDTVRIDSKERIVAGFIHRPSTQNLPAVDVLVRLNADGSFDRQTEVPFVRTHGIPRRFEPTPDGRLLLFGRHIGPSGSLRPGLICLNDDLTIDDSFTSPILTNEFVQAVLVLPDGKFVVAAESSNGLGWLRRFHPNGILDTTFNFEGRFVVSASALGQQSDGRLLVQYNYSIHRVETNGVVDATFIEPTSLPGYFKSQLAIGLDDAIYFEGSQGLERRFPNGRRDDSFSPTSTGIPRVDPSGRIVLFSPERIARINPDGSDDPTFAPVYSPERFVHNFSNFAIDRQGRIIVVGNLTSLAGVPRNQLARLNATNTLQGIGLVREAFLGREGGPAFFILERTGDAPESGSVRYRISPLSAQPGEGFQPQEGEIAFASLERIKLVPVILADDSVAGEDQMLLIELSALPANSIPRRLRGTLRILDNDRVRDSFDLSFGSLVPPAHSPVVGDFQAVAVQPDGNILVIDPVGAPSAVQRLLPSGEPDPAFSPLDLQGRKLAHVQPDGKLLLADRYSLLRHNPDGTEDGSFQFLPDPGFWISGAKAHPTNGSILVYGSSSNGPAILRLIENGGRDESFRFTPPLDLVEKYASVEQLIYGTDDSVFVAADWTISSPDGLRANKVLHLNPDGSMDARFKTVLAPLKHLQLWAADRDGSLLLSTTDTGGERLFRQLPDGSIDPSFAPVQLYLTNADWPLLGSVIIQPDRRILLAGSFERCNGVPSHGILRLNPDGSLDHSFELWPNEMFGPVDHRNNAIANIVPTQGEGEYLLNAMQVRPVRRGWNLSTSRGTAILRFTTASLPHLHSISFSESGALFHADPGAFSNLSLEFSDNLRDWQPLSRATGPAVVADQELMRYRFYRARTTATSGQTPTASPPGAR